MFLVLFIHSFKQFLMMLIIPVNDIFLTVISSIQSNLIAGALQSCQEHSTQLSNYTCKKKYVGRVGKYLEIIIEKEVLQGLMRDIC